MRYWLIAIIAVFIFSSVGRSTSPTYFRFEESELPIGGAFIQHPKTGTWYYFVSAHAIGQNRENFGKRCGLYFSNSTDPKAKGRFALLQAFDFKQIFIHPTTHRFYALMPWNLVAPGDHRKFQPRAGAYLAWSRDGVEWYDMTPPDTLLQAGAHMTNAFGREESMIVVDPDNPNRICVTILGTGGFILRAVDDELLNWETISLRDWQRQHPASPPSTQPTNP